MNHLDTGSFLPTLTEDRSVTQTNSKITMDSWIPLRNFKHKLKYKIATPIYMPLWKNPRSKMETKTPEWP